MEAMCIAEELAAFPRLYETRLFTEDFTEEALTRLMSEQGGAITLASDEGGFLINIKGRYKSIPDLDAILKSYPGTAITIDRIGRPPIRIEKPRLTVMLCCQPSLLRGFLGDEVLSGRGMTARFLYSQPASLAGKREPDAPPVPEQIEQVYHEFVKHHLMEKSTGMITLSPDAWDLFKVSMEEVEKSFREDQFESVEAWRGKYNGNLLRICGLLHASMSTDPVGEPVPASTMLAAGIIAEFFYQQFDELSQITEQSKEEQGARYILSRIKGYRVITKAELTSLCRSKKHFRQTADMEPALELLIQRGYIRRRTRPINYNGRVQIEFELNPAYT